MAIEILPTWTFEPNWAGTYTEAFEWLTDVLTSPKGAEQRRSLRAYPRKTIEFTSAIGNNDRQVFRQFLEAHSGRNFYLPQWHESYRSGAGVLAGSTSIPVPFADNGGIRVGDVLFIDGEKSRQFELVEVSALSSTTVTLASPLDNGWEAFSKVHPVRKARLDDQPTLRKVSDSAMSFSINFRIMERNDDAPSDAVVVSHLDVYEGLNVLQTPPDEGDNTDFAFSRIMDELDNDTSIPQFFDIAGIPFPTQKHNWVSSGRQDYGTLKSLLFRLRGRWGNLWLPSFTDDMRLANPTPAGDQYLLVENFGFTLSGGIQVGHDHLAIFFCDGRREYRRITSSTVLNDDVEVIGVDQPFAEGLVPEDVMRVSFMRLSRLDQDRIEIVHVTDTQGVSRCAATFKSAPPLRTAQAGF
ncbi:hypothetical protein G6L16_009045 [Agrobacterium tumefaciens]|uniref:hypothetical protein n=1 Tax=Agrobacterium tumefaciens TaxID=358 RepID=UPI0015728D5D|nr:hypothetical protein [Agrobacterium tumefaciens]NSZ63485.1 DUF2460 domain-containing protein [Agrobacterium tumefaciens]NTA69855.1 DUF2460 domain-containing protein [Agrobacterium tumefaciens]WIE37000.1 hypothetical protein G6L16_009045 [Agrobacterium tumefaciens]